MMYIIFPGYKSAMLSMEQNWNDCQDTCEVRFDDPLTCATLLNGNGLRQSLSHI